LGRDGSTAFSITGRANIVAVPFLGNKSDKIGYRRVLLIPTTLRPNSRSFETRVASIKRDLAQWLDQEPAHRQETTIALLETTFDRYLASRPRGYRISRRPPPTPHCHRKTAFYTRRRPTGKSMPDRLELNFALFQHPAPDVRAGKRRLFRNTRATPRFG
jgi:hypothetical protein